jgi:DNA-binding PadR family transcriptional regulator
VLSPLAVAVLELLRESPAHPYEIRRKMLGRQADRLTKISVGSLYHAVEKLERRGFIEVVKADRKGRRPERTTYRITSGGSDAFLRHVEAMVSEVTSEHPSFAMGIAYLRCLPPGSAAEALRRRSITLRARVASEKALVDRLMAAGPHPLLWIDMRYRLTMYQAELDWIEQLLDRIGNGELQ